MIYMATQLVELGPEALNHIANTLSRGNSLSRNHLKSLRLNLGRVFVRAPQTASAETITQLDKGGFSDHRFTIPSLVEHILEYLRSSSSGFVVFDGILTRRSDPVLLRS